MLHEQAPTEKPYEKSKGERRGLVIVNTGDGKGKSTAAFGLALRAHGRAKKVKVFQFMKVPSARFGEHRMFEQLGIPIEGLGDGFSWKSQDLKHSAQLARDGWQKAKAAIASGDYFMVTLDEITYPLIYGWMPLDELKELTGIDLPDDNQSHTAAGFVVQGFGRLPEAGDHFDAHGWRFEVLDLDGRRVDKILAEKLSRRRAR